MTTRDTLTDLGFKLLNGFHRGVLRLSAGRLGGRAFGMDAVELRCVGRRSGLLRTTMLTVPVTHEGAMVLVASKGGDDRYPDWYFNLVATPDVEIRRRGATLAVRARVASREERDLLWPQVVAAYRPYASYQRRAKREIPLVICEPR
jgi:deazaflavin-dependent oxidoreductase (nitroreductase family)